MARGTHNAIHIPRDCVRDYIKLIQVKYPVFVPEKASIYAGKSVNYIRSFTRNVSGANCEYYNADILLSTFIKIQAICKNYIEEVLHYKYEEPVYTTEGELW